MMATMTAEERTEYKRKMAERLGTIQTTTTTTTTVYYPGEVGEEDTIKAQGAGVVESGAVAYGMKDHDPAHVIALKEEKDRKRKEEEERERKRKEEEEERERERQREREREEERERERERRRKELERLA